MGVAEPTLGLAAVTLLSGGKIAYLLFDRIRHVALSSGGEAADILGLVIAHEMGHLLLPFGSHSQNGLMRPSWRPEDFTLGSQPAFTQAQADGIRELLVAGEPRVGSLTDCRMIFVVDGRTAAVSCEWSSGHQRPIRVQPPASLPNPGRAPRLVRNNS
jgi:hypothetical protein